MSACLMKWKEEDFCLGRAIYSKSPQRFRHSIQIEAFAVSEVSINSQANDGICSAELDQFLLMLLEKNIPLVSPNLSKTHKTH